MRPLSSLVLLLTALLALSACRKNLDSPIPSPSAIRLFDTTTIERIESVLDAPGNPLLSAYYFQYDSVHRIKQSWVITYPNGPALPETSYYRKYFYKGQDSLPESIVYGNNQRGAAGSFLRDTAYLFYDAANRLVKDSGTTYEDWGFGLIGYASRINDIRYITSDSFVVTTTIKDIMGGPATPATSQMQVKNSIVGGQYVQKKHNPAGAVTHTYTATYDGGKNPLAKALLQVHPYYDPMGYAIGDGSFGWHLPQSTNRTLFSIGIGPSSISSRRDNYNISYNAQNLPIGMVELNFSSGSSATPHSTIKHYFYY
jgi:hypothetical protein